MNLLHARRTVQFEYPCCAQKKESTHLEHKCTKDGVCAKFHPSAEEKMDEPPREEDLVNEWSTHENQDGPRDQKENKPYPHGVIAHLLEAIT